MIKFLTPDTTSFKSFYDKGRYLLAWRFVMLFTFVFFILGISFIKRAPESSLIYFIVSAISAGMMFYIRFAKKFILLYWVFTFCASILITYTLNFMRGSLHYADFVWMIAIVLVAYIGLGKKWCYFIIGYHSLSIAYFIFFRINENIQHVRPLTIYERIGGTVELIFGFILIAYLFRLYLQLRDHSEIELQKANKELNTQNKLIAAKSEENLTLIKEIHHRVKNNLQIVISLLRMQSNELENKETKKQFDEAINRIMAISLIHQKLYQEKQLSFIRFETYFQDLVGEIQSLYPQEIKIVKQFDPRMEEIGLKTIVPLGLLLNELMTNSFKHGLQGNSGDIKISFKQKDKKHISFLYSDSGKWKENNANDGFGMELIKLLTEQLEGTMDREESKYTFNLKNMDLV